MKKEKKTKQKEEPKEDKVQDNNEPISDENLNNILRSLTVIYGFFFVFMSTMVAGAQVLNTSLVDSGLALLFFAFIFSLSMACSMIGIEIFMILYHMGISLVGEWGIRIVVAFVPTVFTFIIGYTVLSDKTFFEISLPPLIYWFVSLGQIVFIVIIYFKTKGNFANEKVSKTTSKKK